MMNLTPGLEIIRKYDGTISTVKRIVVSVSDLPELGINTSIQVKNSDGLIHWFSPQEILERYESK